MAQTSTGGGRQGHSQGQGMITGINVTPLVDVTLVLLVIFIVTAKIIVAPAVPLDLPAASHGQEVQMVLSVVVPLEGPLFVNGQPLASDADLVVQARTAVTANPEARAVLSIDGHVEHARVVSILDRLATGGLTKVAFGTAPEPLPPTDTTAAPRPESKPKPKESPSAIPSPGPSPGEAPRP